MKAFGFLTPPILALSLDFEVINFKLFLFALIGNSTQNTKSLLFKFKLLTFSVLPITNVYKTSLIPSLKKILPILVKIKLPIIVIKVSSSLEQFFHIY